MHDYINPAHPSSSLITSSFRGLAKESSNGAQTQIHNTARYLAAFNSKTFPVQDLLSKVPV